MILPHHHHHHYLCCPLTVHDALCQSPTPTSGTVQLLRRDRDVYLWVVDRVSDALALLQEGVRGVVSNRPIALLHALRRRRIELCPVSNAEFLPPPI